jgi:WD40 repeat protein
MDWDLCLQTLEGHNEPVSQVVLSPDSSLIASSSQKKLLIWRSHTGTCIHEINASRQKAISFSRDSRFFYCVLSSGAVETWETDTWTRKAVIKVESATRNAMVRAAAISHDCTLVAVAFGTVIEIRSISKPGDIVNSIKTHNSYPTNLTFSPNSAYIVVKLRVSDSLLEMLPVSGGESTVIEHCFAAAYSPDSSLLALGFKSVIKIRRVDEQPMKTHRKISLEEGCKTHSLAFSHDAALLAIGLQSKSNSFGIWSTDTGDCIWTVNDHTSIITSLLFSHNSTFLVSASYDETLRIYSVSKHPSPEVHERQHVQADSVTISPDSSLVLLKPYIQPGSCDAIWQVLRADSGVCVKEFAHEKLQSEPTFTQDSALAVIRGGAAEIWHPDGHHFIQDLNGLGSDPTGVPVACFSADFTLAAGILKNRSLRIWQINTGECKREVQSAVPDDCPSHTLCFSPDASRIACAPVDGNKVFVWQVDTDTPAQRFELPRNDTCNYFALSNTKLAVTNGIRSLTIWSLKRGGFLREVEHIGTDDIVKLGFSHDSTLLATSSISQGMRIWNADTDHREWTMSFNLLLKTTHLSFELPNNSELCTNFGRIKFKDSATLGENAADARRFGQWRFDKLSYSDTGRDGDSSWISFNGEKLLWLPTKYRGVWRTPSAVSESVVAIASSHSRPHVIIGFDLEKIPKWYQNAHKYFSSRM